MVDYNEKAIEVLTEHHPKGLHVNDLAGLLLKKYQNLQISKDDLAAKYANRFPQSSGEKVKKSRFQKLKNKRGGYQKGIYRIKKG